MTRTIHIAAKFHTAVLIGTLIGIAGCNQVSEQPAGPDGNDATGKQPKTSQSAPTTAENPKPVVTWDALYMQGQKIGYARMERKDYEHEGVAIVEYSHEQLFRVQRQGDATETTMAVVCQQSRAGHLISFESQMKQGPVAAITRGVVRGNVLQMESEVAGKKVQQAVPWQADWGGCFAMEQSLKNKPLQVGETRKLRQLMPVLNCPADITIQGVRQESTKMLDDTQELLRIEAKIVVDNPASAGPPLTPTLWMDTTGEIVKMDHPTLGTQFRTTKEVATSQKGLGTFDLAMNTTVFPKGKLTRPHDSQQIVYQARLKSTNPLEVFSSGPSQTVTAIDDRTATITVRAIRPDTPLPKVAGGDEDKPQAEDLAANSLVQSDNPKIQAMADMVAGKSTDPWQIAQALEAHVQQVIRKKNYSKMFLSAAEVVEQLEGDCTEHSVLLAALCRAKKIPARTAVGLVSFQSGGKPAFGYHMWTEVWIADRWVPLDGTLGRGGIGGGHIKLTHSNLKGADAYSAMLPVIHVIGQLELEVIDAK